MKKDIFAIVGYLMSQYGCKIFQHRICWSVLSQLLWVECLSSFRIRFWQLTLSSVEWVWTLLSFLYPGKTHGEIGYQGKADGYFEFYPYFCCRLPMFSADESTSGHNRRHYNDGSMCLMQVLKVFSLGKLHILIPFVIFVCYTCF